MQNKPSKKIRKNRSFVANLLRFLSLKAPAVFAQIIPPPQGTMVVYASPEVMTCGRNKVCLFFLNNTKITIGLGIIILLAIVFGLAKFLAKIIAKIFKKNKTK